MTPRKTFYTLLTAALIAGCSAGAHVASSKYFADAAAAEDGAYGYTPEQPVKVRNGDQPRSMRTMYDFVGALKTENGNYLELVSRYSVDNPNYAGPGSVGPSGNDPAPMLDKVLAVPQGEPDTLVLYFNTFMSEEVKVPKGLILDPSKL